MKKLILSALLLIGSLQAWAQFSPGQILTAAALNSQFALYMPLGGGALTGPLTVPTITVTGALNATGLVTTSDLAMQGGNTVLANATASSASPAAFTMPSCSSSTSALQWTSGTGFTCYGSSASLAGATFTGATSVSYTNPRFVVNDSSGSNVAGVQLQNNGTNIWNLQNTSSSNTFTVTRYVGGVTTDNPISVSNSTGIVTFADGITGAIGASSANSGAFTTLSASSTVSGTGFSTYLASPPAIGGTTAAAGTFTTLTATGVIAPSTTNGIKGTTAADNANAGSVGEYSSNSATAVSLTSGSQLNLTSTTLSAGDWDVDCVVDFLPAASTTYTTVSASVSTTSGTPGSLGSAIVYRFSNLGAGTENVIASPMTRVNVSASTPVYCVGGMTFATSTATANAFIRARRVR